MVYENYRVEAVIVEFTYGAIVLGLIALGVLVAHGIVVNALLSTSISLGDFNVALGIFYVNALSLAVLITITYYYVVYGKSIIPVLRKTKGFGNVLARIYEAVTVKWTKITPLIVTLVFTVSFVRTAGVVGVNVTLHDMLRVLVLPHTHIELIVVYLALWGTAKLGNNFSTLILLTITLTLMLVASALIEVTLSPILLYYVVNRGFL